MRAREEDKDLAAVKKRRGRTPKGAMKRGDPPRNLKFDNERVAVYLDRLRETGMIRKSAHAAGVSYGAVSDARKRSPLFKSMEKEARHQFLERCETKAFEVAFDGVVEKRYDGRGNLIGETMRYDSKLMMFLMQSLAPEKYRDNKHVLEHTGGVLVAPARLDPLEWAEKEKKRMERAHRDYEVTDLTIVEPGL